MPLGERSVPEQIEQRVREALRLKDLAALHPAMSADDGVAGAHHDVGVLVDGAGAVTELSREAILEASEARRLRLVEAQIVSEDAPGGDGELGERRALDAAEPSHEERQVAARDPIRDEEVQLFLEEDPAERTPSVLARSVTHETVRHRP
ncbi:MAG TPA: hypothetical protein VH062_32530 [Polyangiaceae bacterium]|nr:hypothetical protein [Polyangiaceae bacterium]